MMNTTLLNTTPFQQSSLQFGQTTGLARNHTAVPAYPEPWRERTYQALSFLHHPFLDDHQGTPNARLVYDKLIRMANNPGSTQYNDTLQPADRKILLKAEQKFDVLLMDEDHWLLPDVLTFARHASPAIQQFTPYKRFAREQRPAHDCPEPQAGGKEEPDALQDYLNFLGQSTPSIVVINNPD